MRNGRSPGPSPGAGLRAALAAHRSLRGVQVSAGIQSVQGTERDPESGATLVEIAAKNEFGTDGPPPIPSRPWLRTALQTNARKWQRLAGDVVKSARSPEGAEPALRTLGVVMVGDCKESLLDGDWAPNAPLTIERKGSDQPLVDTGRLNQSQRAQVAIPGKGAFLLG